MQFSQRQRQSIAIIILIIVLLVGWQVGLLISRHGKVKLTVEAVPHDSIVTLDGKEINSHGTTYVDPGTYKITASRQYFNDASQQINTDQLTDQTIYLLPTPKQPEGFDWLKDHRDVQQRREVVAGIIQQNKQDALLQKYPVLKSLPANYTNFSVDYRVDDSAVTFIVTPLGTDTKRSVTDAMNFLEEHEVDRNKANVTVSNVRSLLDFGLTEAQVNHFQQSLANFAKSHNQAVKTSIIVNNKVGSAPLDDSGNFGYAFQLNLNGQTYDASVRYNILNATIVTLNDAKTHKTIYSKTYND